jgi:hypothetical protein
MAGRSSEQHDPVNHPSHYTQGKIEVLDFIEDQGFGYLAGNVVKYVARYRWKGSPVEDLRKARYYLDRLIEEHGGEPPNGEGDDE